MYNVHIATGKDKIFLPDMQIAGIPGTLLSGGIDSAFSKVPWPLVFINCVIF